MACFVNRQSVFLYCVAKSNQILLLKESNSPEHNLESYSIVCPVSETPSSLSKASHVKEHHVVYTAISNCGKFVAACDSNNSLHLWKRDTNTWLHQSARQMIRKCQKLIFTNSGSEVIVADRSGDVFAYSVSDCQKGGKFLLGHNSLIIDIAISSDDKYLLSCDRDGKIRISHYPNSYNIHNYCLGHEEFVSSVQCIDLSKEVILTSSGDASIKLWNFNGHLLCSVNLFENEILQENSKSCKNTKNSQTTFSCEKKQDKNQTAFAVKNVKYSPKNKAFAVSFYSVKGVAIYCINEENFKFIKFFPTDSIPYDMFFDLNGNLVILQKSKKQYLYYQCMEETSLYFKEIDTDTVPLLLEFKKICENIENLHEFQDTCDTLFKRNFEDKEYNVLTKNKKSKIVNVELDE